MGAVEYIKSGSRENPYKTRQNVFLEQYPEAQIDDNGVLYICPALISSLYRKGGGRCKNANISCGDCRQKFWTQEV